MSTLKDIANRHVRDRWKDAFFIGAALLLTALAVGSVTSKSQGKETVPHGSVTVVESNLEIVR